jgi:uncharacterized protein DUF4148
MSSYEVHKIYGVQISQGAVLTVMFDPAESSWSLKMKSLKLLTISVVGLAMTMDISNAIAQAKTREEVRQELIQAENDGSRFVTDASYPDISPMYQQQVAQMKALSARTGEGVGVSGSSGSGSRAGKPRPCVGPLSYCNPYGG